MQRLPGKPGGYGLRAFNNTSQMTLKMGAVGSLGENTDALPCPGAD